MQNYNQQQQAVILKGIAQQLLSMNVPSFEQARKLLSEFGIDNESDIIYSQMYMALKVAVALSDETKKSLKEDNSLKYDSDLAHLIAHHAMKMSEPNETRLMNAIFQG